MNVSSIVISLVYPRNPPGPPAVENVPPPAQNVIPAGAEAAAVGVVDFPINDQLNDTITLSDDEEVNPEHQTYHSILLQFVNRITPSRPSCRRDPTRVARTRWTRV